MSYNDHEKDNGNNIWTGLAIGGAVLGGLYMGEKAYEHHKERKRREQEDRDIVYDYDQDYYNR